MWWWWWWWPYHMDNVACSCVNHTLMWKLCCDTERTHANRHTRTTDRHRTDPEKRTPNVCYRIVCRSTGAREIQHVRRRTVDGSAFSDTTVWSRLWMHTSATTPAPKTHTHKHARTDTPAHELCAVRTRQPTKMRTAHIAHFTFHMTCLAWQNKTIAQSERRFHQTVNTTPLPPRGMLLNNWTECVCWFWIANSEVAGGISVWIATHSSKSLECFTDVPMVLI